jgi:phage terminase large subunit
MTKDQLYGDCWARGFSYTEVEIWAEHFKVENISNEEYKEVCDEWYQKMYFDICKDTRDIDDLHDQFIIT